jgi:hypothetical protein
MSSRGALDAIESPSMTSCPKSVPSHAYVAGYVAAQQLSMTILTKLPGLSRTVQRYHEGPSCTLLLPDQWFIKPEHSMYGRRMAYLLLVSLSSNSVGIRMLKALQARVAAVHTHHRDTRQRAKRSITARVVFPVRMVVLKNTSLLDALRQCLRQAW